MSMDTRGIDLAVSSPHLRPFAAQEKLPEVPPSRGDGVTLRGGTDTGAGLIPRDASSQKQVLTSTPGEDNGIHLAHQTAFTRATCAALAGVMAVIGLTGCNGPKPSPNPSSSVSTTVDAAAQTQLKTAFEQAEKAINASNTGDPQKAAADVTRNLLGQIEQYAKKTGRSAEQVASDVKSYAISHPAVSLTVLMAAGITSGVLLEKYGVPEAIANGAGSILESVTHGTSDGLSAITSQIKAHPFIAAGIGVAVAGTVVYVVHEVMASPHAVAAVPDTPQKEQLVKSLDALESQVASAKSGDVNAQAKDVSQRFMDTVGEYAKATGKGAKEVASDVKDFMVTHPGVTAAVVLSAGVTTGVLLEKAGVPGEVAALATQGFEQAKAGATSGLAGLKQTIEDHPVLSTVVIGALVAGTGYLVYEHFVAPPAARVAQPPGK